MSHTYKSLVDNGGCRIAYAWNVSGFPWLVCSDPALVALLQSPSTSADASFARKRMLGNTQFGDVVPAHEALVFDTLHHELGTQTTKCNSVGVAEVSGWSIKILDSELGATWPHVVDGDEVFGLEGCHRIADLDDEIHAWGFLADNLRPDATSVDIHEETGDDGSGPLYDRITALGDYRYLWMGHECIAVHGVSSGAYPDYSATILARGCFRSKNQYHFVEAIDQVNQKIADVPQSIIGHYCWLWAIPLTADGQFYRDAEDNPIIALESARCGIVSESVRTDRGVTQINIGPCLDALKNKVDYLTTENIKGHVGRYTFCRGDSGTNWEDILSKRQKPHLYFMEYYLDPVSDYGTWIYKPLWLCAKNTVVQFETLEELVDAVNDEIQKLYLYGSTSGASGTDQNTGDGTGYNDYVGLEHSYTVTKDYFFRKINENNFTFTYDGTLAEAPMWFMKQNTGGPLEAIRSAGDNGFELGKWSMVGGIVQVILGLGIPHFTDKYRVPIQYRFAESPKSNYNLDFYNPRTEIIFGAPLMDLTKNFASGVGNFYTSEFQFQEFLPYVGEVSGELIVLGDTDYSNHSHMVPVGLCQRAEMLDLEMPADFMCAKSFIGWDWINHPAHEWVPDIDQLDNFDIDTNGKLYLCVDPVYADNTFWVSLTDANQFIEDAKISIGDYVTNIAEWHSENGSLYFEISNDSANRHLIESTSNTQAIRVGSSLICIPAYSLPSDASPEDISDPTKLADSYDHEKDDPFLIRLFRGSFSSSISNIFRAILGYEDTDVWIPEHERRYPIPFFRDDPSDGSTSFIDWDSLTDMTDGMLQSLIPAVPRESFVIKDELDEILRSMGLGMYEDWDEASKQIVYRFRKYGNIIASTALNYGRVIGMSDLLSGESVEEDHLLLPIFNRIKMTVVEEESFLKYENDTVDISVINTDVSSVIDRSILELTTSPMMLVLRKSAPFFPEPLTVRDHLIKLLYRLGDKKPTQTRTLLCSARFRSAPGRECLMTDPMAHYPATHGPGLESANVMITEQRVDLTNNTIRISYLVSGDNAVHGYAPSCRVAVSSVVLNEDGFTCEPEDNYGSSSVRDIFFFDCFDLSNSEAPMPRVDSCTDYAVLVYSQDNAISADNPIVGTCRVIDDSGTWKLRVFCDESKLPSTGNLIITYGEFDNCQPDQKLWLFFSDSNGRVGIINRRGDVWR